MSLKIYNIIRFLGFLFGAIRNFYRWRNLLYSIFLYRIYWKITEWNLLIYNGNGIYFRKPCLNLFYNTHATLLFIIHCEAGIDKYTLIVTNQWNKHSYYNPVWFYVLTVHKLMNFTIQKQHFAFLYLVIQVLENRHFILN